MRRSRWLASVVALAALVILFAACHTRSDATVAERPRAVILMIGDGFGISQLTLSRNVLAGTGHRLALESLPVVGLVSTYSASNAVTDSGAAATALASGTKTDNKFIGLDSSGKPVRLFSEVARERGFRLGYVTTTRITHATPASFYAHVKNRDDEETIAQALVDQAPDVALGGGLGFFIPQSAQGMRTDGRDLVEEAKKRGITVWRRGDDRSQVKPRRLLGLFAWDHLAYSLDDRRSPEAQRAPSLESLTSLALEILDAASRDAGSGFFLMVEGGRIDHACHHFDAAGTVAETQSFDRAVSVALDYQKRRPDTLIVLTADHATGGLAINDSVDWQALGRQRASLFWLAGQIRNAEAGRALLAEMTGFTDFTEEELRAVRAKPDGDEAARELGRQMERRLGVTWGARVDLQSTIGHTGEDVALFAGGPGSERFRGLLDNGDLPRILCEILGWPGFN